MADIPDPRDPELLHAKLHDVKQGSAGLFRDAINEIHALRRQVGELQGYKNHTERMLAMFEGGPRGQGYGDSPMSDDVTYRLERMEREYVDPVDAEYTGG